MPPSLIMGPSHKAGGTERRLRTPPKLYFLQVSCRMGLSPSLSDSLSLTQNTQRSTTGRGWDVVVIGGSATPCGFTGSLVVANAMYTAIPLISLLPPATPLPPTLSPVPRPVVNGAHRSLGIDHVNNEAALYQLAGLELVMDHVNTKGRGADQRVGCTAAAALVNDASCWARDGRRRNSGQRTARGWPAICPKDWILLSCRV